jgi:hypothetical protein
MPKSFEEMKDELASPKVLICPNDPKQVKATTWSEFNFSNASYVIDSPGISTTNDPRTVYARCPIHGTACYLDGSVQQQGRQGQRAPAQRNRQPRQR